MKRGTYKPSLNMLPYDILMVILSKVAVVSHFDLGGCMVTCKDMLNVSKYPEVLLSLRLEEIIDPPYEIVPNAMNLVEECAKYGNIHAIFLCGLFNYFHLKLYDIGLSQLKTAAEATNSEAMYLYGMLMLIKGQFVDGCDYLTQLWKNQGYTTVRQCCINVKKVILEMNVREYREYDILLSLLEIHEKCIVGGIDEVCDDCFVRKEVGRFMDYLS